uniref:Minor tail protein n=1 Tax=Siphoviridae sp. ctlNl18 TaxID=2827928 RepID=A0A8S5T4F1_9CAUD|nr:MAG TPA: minor tail protein [Siphoviridae sp. ctlNl18]
MKQQFLNDSGLTELIGYIKKYVKDEQDVKPYASLSVFPKTGEQNIIYIDTTVNASYYWDDTSKTYKALDVQTWATLNGKPTTFPPEDHNHDDRYFTETEMNSKLAGKADSSHTHKKADITDFPTSMPASDVPAWAKASIKPTYTKAEVGLGNVDNTADKDKSVKYATSSGSAGTASSVDWSGVKNSPSTYAPSAHTHGSGDITSLSADKITGVIGIDHLPAGALERCKIVADDTARFKLTTSDVQNGDVVKVGTDANAKMYFVIDETKLSSEDGYTVFSAGTATSVPWSGVTGKPSTFTPSAHTHDDRYYTESEINSKLDGKSNTGHTHDDRYYTESEMNTKLAGKSDTSHSHNLSTMINALEEGTSAPTDDDYYIAQYAGGGTTTTTYYRRPHSALWSYIKGKADSVYQVKGSYAASSHTHTIAQISNLQSILDSKASASHTHTIANVTGLQSALDGKAASVHTHSYAGSSSAGGSANSAVKLDTTSAGSATQPVYFSGGKPVATTYTLGASVPSGAKFTDTDTWRPLGTTADTACAGNDSRLSNARPASDVYSWAKASSKPSYSWGEISGKPSTFTPSSHNHTLIAEVASSSTVPGKAADGFIEFYYNVNTGLTNNMPSNNNANAIISLSRHAGDYSSQLGFSSDGNIYYRDGVGTTSWRTVLDSSNYTSYTVTKTGSGASGTWGINVTGSAGSVAWGNVSGRPSSLPASDVYAWAKASSKPSYSWSEISNKPSSMPASDVYAWAKASSKPSYSWGEISGKPSTFTPSSHTHNYAGSSSAGGNANWANGASYANYAIKTACNPTEDKSTNGLFMFQHSENTTICPDSAWWSVVRTQHAGYNNGYWQEMAYRFDSDIIKFRRNVNGSKSAWKTIAFTDSKVSSAGYADSAGSANSVAWGNVSGKPSTYTPSSHSHNYAGSGSAGGSANSAVKLDTSTAGSATQPVYFTNGKPAACSYTLGKSVPSNAVFTDTNTWRPVINNLISTATDQSLSANQGRVLNDKLNKLIPIGYIFVWNNKNTSGNAISGAPDLTTASGVANYFGIGTWQRIDGRFLFGYSSNRAAGSTGGSESVTLSTSQIPSHTHSIPALSGWAANNGAHAHNVRAKYTNNCATKSNGAARANGGGNNTSDWRFGDTDSQGVHGHNVSTNASTTGSNGSGNSHENMPPYFAVYIWQRIA